MVGGFDTPNDPATPEWVRECVSFGVIRLVSGRSYKVGMTVETETSYLDRRGLLTRAERRVLGTWPAEETIFAPVGGDDPDDGPDDDPEPSDDGDDERFFHDGVGVLAAV